jgi:hypothetical protein
MAVGQRDEELLQTMNATQKCGGVGGDPFLHPLTSASCPALSIDHTASLTMSQIAGGMLRFLGIFQIREGTLVRIRNSTGNPLAGQTGTIIAVSPADPYGPYLVEFMHGLRFRYQALDFSIATCPDAVQEDLRRS